ncbi:MAG: hypothetical protein JSW22_07710 [Chloroflexota bacterium]|nr:MAG: hypothetical protein JSW22_07710 [Chloroflexota bacterium]
MKVLEVPQYLNIESRTVRYTLYTLFAIIVADGLISQFMVTSGYGSEGNPFLMSMVGSGAFLDIKISGAFLATLFLWTKYSTKPRFVNTVAVTALALYTAIVFWNLLAFILAA